MKTKLLASIVALFVVTSIFAQTNLNNYKYVIVPTKFDFLKENNQYRLNELAQFLFNKYGFTAVMEGSEYPEDLMIDRCLALRSDAIKDSGMFKTKIKVTLKDCNDRVVYTSQMGESREKEYNTAYNKALREAFTSFETLNYKYEPKKNVVPTQPTKVVEDVKSETKEEIEKLRQEIETLKKAKETAKVQEVVEEVIETPKVEVAVQEKKEIQPVGRISESSSDVLYAQAIAIGFQLVDSSPKVIYRIKNTGLNNVFLVEGKNALIYKNGDDWMLEHYENETLKQEKLNIKF